jgi:hypothetical protein
MRIPYIASSKPKRIANRHSIQCLLVFLVFCSPPVLGQSNAKAPTLGETLQWLRGTTDKESPGDTDHHEFETNGGDDSCSVTIVETRINASPGFWIRISFSLADIDPADIQIHPIIRGQSAAVTFHTRNYVEKITETSWRHDGEQPISEYDFFTNDRFAPRFANALKRAVELCGGKPSSF